MSILLKRRCCCLKPCDCPPGSPWIAGRSTYVSVRATIEGVAIEGGSVRPPIAMITWGAIRPSPGGLVWRLAASKWYSLSGAIEPCQAGAYDSESAYCAHLASYLGQGRAWTVSGTSSDTAVGGCYPAARAKCEGATMGHSKNATTFASSGIGFEVTPDLPSWTFDNIQASSSFTASCGASETDTHVTVTALGAANFTCRGLYPWTRYDDPNNGCDGPSGTYTRGFWLGWRVVWFQGSMTIPKAEVCAGTSITLANSITPGYVPAIAHTLTFGTPTQTFTCPDIMERGTWFVGSGGTATFTLEDCGGSFGALAVPPDDASGVGEELLVETPPVGEPSDAELAAALVQGVLDDDAGDA